ncbi:MAG: HDIG domain-containing metalloprotein [Chloroflexota bacterium]
MLESSSSTPLKRKTVLPIRQRIWLIILLLLTCGLAFIAIVGQQLISSNEPILHEGDVASVDILAPSAISYKSLVLTEEVKQAAAEAISPIYFPPDAAIIRQQADRLQAALDYISSVREKSNTPTQQKLEDLSALESISLTKNTSLLLLTLSDEDWFEVKTESVDVLGQVMRNAIREDQLNDAQLSIPSLINLSFAEEQAAIVTELVSAFIAPNSFYSEELTEAAQKAARDAIPPVIKNFLQGETVIRRGEVISAEDVEALAQLGLVEPQKQWRDFISPAIIVLILSAIATLFIRQNQTLYYDLTTVHIIAPFFLLFLFGARLLIPGHTVVPYAYPIAAYGLLLAVFFQRETAIAFSIPLSILAAYNLPNSQDLTLYYLLGSLFGVLMLRKAERLLTFIWAGMGVAISGAATVIAIRILEASTDWIGLVTLGAASIVNGVVSVSLALAIQFFLSQLLGLTTPIHLLELSRPDHPLLKLLLRNASGTYQHSLQVANLAEQAAEAIEADALLTRVGALYHDTGKVSNPYYFIENQVPGSTNPHDELGPLTSSEILRKHVTEGLELARKYRLPRRIRDFIAEHHGSMITRYQYAQAVNNAGGDEGQVHKDEYRYPGPRPQSRETAILMLADGCEARVRAERPQTEKALRAMVQSVINHRLEQGQLDDTDLTLHDLQLLVESFTTTLRGVYHPRLTYPKLEAKTKKEIYSETGVVEAKTSD